MPNFKQRYPDVDNAFGVQHRITPLGPHQPVEAVARAEVRAGALPVLDDPREAGLRERRPDRSCRDLVGHDGHPAAVSFAICGAVSNLAGRRVMPGVPAGNGSPTSANVIA